MSTTNLHCHLQVHNVKNYNLRYKEFEMKHLEGLHFQRVILVDIDKNEISSKQGFCL